MKKVWLSALISSGLALSWTVSLDIRSWYRRSGEIDVSFVINHREG
ncbi:hypothetical protein JOC76_005090 [Neobacillus cucumis]|nr:hypothetical protein [Neobacillus cucumis]MBM7655579.1 hypothetical protein [Neobacillus cucumis]